MSLFYKISQFISVVAMSTLFAGSVWAIDASQKEAIIKALKLTDAQQTKIESITNDALAQYNQINQEYAGKTDAASQQAMAQQVDTLHTQTQAKIVAELNPAQKMKFEQLEDMILRRSK